MSTRNRKIAPGVLKSHAIKVACMAMLAYGAPMARKKLRKMPVQKPRQVTPTAAPERDLGEVAKVEGMDRCKLQYSTWMSASAGVLATKERTRRKCRCPARLSADSSPASKSRCSSESVAKSNSMEPRQL